MPRPSKTHQLDLFLCNPETAQMPLWQALPEQSRLRLRKLMVRLILDHVDGERAVQREGTDHDA